MLQHNNSKSQIRNIYILINVWKTDWFHKSKYCLILNTTIIFENKNEMDWFHFFNTIKNKDEFFNIKINKEFVKTIQTKNRKCKLAVEVWLTQ